MNHFSSEKLSKKAPKHENVVEPPDMTIEDYLSVSKLSMRLHVSAKLQLSYVFFTCVLFYQVMPEWCYGKADAWEALASRWLGEDAAFRALSERNKANRGTSGTHCAGAHSHGRFKEKLVWVLI